MKKMRKRHLINQEPIWRGHHTRPKEESSTIIEPQVKAEAKPLEEVINIVQQYSLSKVILLAHIDKQGNGSSIFNPDWQPLADIRAAYLMLITNTDNIDRQALVCSIEQRCKPLCDLSCIVFSTHGLKHLIENQNRFIIRSLQAGQVLYQQWAPAPHVQQAILSAPIRDIETTELIGWYQRSQLFSQTASIHHHLGNYGMAAFCLHQAVEQLSTLLHLAAIGYNLAIHNLDRLLRYLRFFYREIADSINKRTPSEEKRFQFFNDQYVNFRYKNDIPVTESDIQCFFHEFKLLQVLADRILYSSSGSTSFIPNAPSPT